MNDKDRDKIKEIAINIREGADNVETVLDSTKEAIFLLINGVNKDGRGGVYGSADQFLNVLLSVASDYLNEKNSRINVNVKSDYYKYPNFPAHPNCLPSIYSREKPYIIDNQALESFWTNTLNVNYQPPFSGPFDPSNTYSLTPCCTNFLKDANQENSTVNNDEIVVYPNPTSKDFTIKFTPHSVGILKVKVIDLLGKVVFEKSENVNEKNISYKLLIQLPNTLPLGQYILLTTLNEQIFSNKLKLQQ